ncbi:hypothetical protein K2173_007991 [Erythroxylum novogranatense]|uniref:Calcium-transporting ATPase n=1 Tax=Erythroxylum novogranatense TaxID=1862640 RepID=A0AAV8T6Z7_9ROSI|nr:hypothetical protein K2173_007991 [Erythroxylum novogranatense]
MDRLFERTSAVFPNDHVPITISEPKKRWQVVVVAIYCSRTISSLTKKTPTKKKATNKVIPPSPSFALLDVNPHNEHFRIPQAALTELVKKKSHNTLRKLGGVANVASAIQTGLQGGISGGDEDMSRRQDAYGCNAYNKPPPKRFFQFVVEAFKDLTIAILLVCAAFSLGFGIKEHGLKEGWYDGGSIFLAVFLVISVSAVTNYRQNNQFHKLSKFSENIKVEVVRGGQRQQVSIFELVVGDVVCLKIGDQVPADGLFIDGHSLQIDESSMTGESDYVEIDHNHNPFLLSGTKVADGFGKMLVVSVGMNTTWGEMMSHVNRDTTEDTPLNGLTSSIGKVGLAVAFLVHVVLLIRYFTGNTQDENKNKEFNGSRTKLGDILNSVVGVVADTVTISVAAIPEGLPLAVTLTLCYSMKGMRTDQAMVRKLSACETLGSATTICTDKTGTLTMNLMKVTKFWLGRESIEHSISSISPHVLELIREGVALNTTGSVYRATPSSGYNISGGPTEKAILSWAVEELEVDAEGMKQSCTVLQVDAFNSQKKRSGVALRKELDNTVHVHWKGAAEMILERCSSYYDASGLKKDMDDHEMNVFKQIVQNMATNSLRCIAFAHRKLSEEEYVNGAEGKKIEDEGLILIGIVGIKDPCRPGVKTAVQVCQNAGVNVKMITGDNVFTARAIAIECGILKPGESMIGSSVVEGEEFRNYTPMERMEKVDQIRVMARSSPFDKLLMVQCLKQKGHVVAVTGNGTNDAPALKEANIGLSMGIQGTEMAKESSDIIILDDNFASVATILRRGRCVYNNIQKFIQFQLTVNVAALVINFVAAVSAGEVPLTAVQLLWVNLIMDTLGALALATEQPTNDLMEKPPVGRTEPLITNIMWRNLLAQALYQISILLTLQFRGESIFGVTKAVNHTLIFNTFILCQVFNEFNARKLEKKNVFKGIHKNRLFMGIVGTTILLQVVMVEFLKKFADTERLNWWQWGVSVGIGALSWPIGWVVKYMPVPEKPIFSYLKWKKWNIRSLF